MRPSRSPPSSSKESVPMAFETLLFAREETFAVITLNRPPANAINEKLVEELHAALASVEDDATVRSVIITGAGDRIFCVGADLGSAFSGGHVDTFIRFGNTVMRKIERFPKPVIAAINGHATGGGCEISMACHFRLMKETARIGQTESNLGIIPGYGGTQRLPRLIGRTKALEMLILGSMITAPEALSLGLVNRLSQEGETLGDARAPARQPGREGGRAAGECRAPAPPARRAPADRDAAPHRGRGRRARGADRQGDRGRGARVPRDAPDGGRRRGHPGVLRQAPRRLQGEIVMDLGIRDRVALVTGGARSLGKADALTLAAEGCKVAIVDLNAEGAEETAKEIEKSGGRARGYVCDIRDTAQVRDVVGKIETDRGPEDICVNNAGMIYTLGQLKDMRDEDWELNLAVNLTGTFKMTRAVFA